MNRVSSWVIVRKDDRTPIAETFLPHVAAAINRDKYIAVPIGEWLDSLNTTRYNWQTGKGDAR